MLSVFSFALLSGCTLVRPQKPGSAAAQLRNGPSAQVTQPENPKQATTQKVESTSIEEIPLPEKSVVTRTDRPGTTNAVVTRIEVAAPTVVKRSSSEKVETSLGAAQKDTARELGARLAAMRPVQWVGVLCLLGAGALAYFGWWTKAAIAGGVGLGMIIVAAVVPGNELLILGIGAAVLAIGCLLVLYSYHKGQLDKNQDGIPDFLQHLVKEGDKWVIQPKATGNSPPKDSPSS